MTIDWEEIAQKMGYQSEEDLLRTLYVDHRLSLREMSKLFNVTSTCIHYRLKRFGLVLRSQGGSNNDSQTRRKLCYIDPRVLHYNSVSALAIMLGVASPTVYRVLRKAKSQ